MRAELSQRHSTETLPSGQIAAPRWRTLLPTALLAALIFALPFGAQISREVASGDMWAHIKTAHNLNSISDLVWPHFLFQVLVKLNAVVFAVSYEAAATFLLASSYAVMAVVIADRAGDLKSDAPRWILLFAPIGILICSHVFVQSLVEWPRIYRGYLAPVVYHNPTQQLAKLFGLLIFLHYLDVFVDKRKAASPRATLFLGCLCVVSALTKPSFLIAFLPVAGLFILMNVWKDGWRSAMAPALAVIVPSVLVLLLQFYMTYGIPGSRSGITFRPFEFFNGPQAAFVKLAAVLLFPGAVLFHAWRTGTLTPRLIFSWVFLVIALLESFLLIETGPRRRHGNFVWTGQLAVFILFVESLLYLLGQRFQDTRLPWLALAIHFLFGVAWYAIHVLGINYSR